MLSARELNTESAAEPHVDQRAPDVHARLRPDARARQPGHPRRPAGAVRPGPAAACRPSTLTIDRAAASTSASCRTTTCSSARRAQEFHYPQGDDNVYAHYEGTGGVPLGSLWRKLLFAMRFRSYQILLSDDIAPGQPRPVPPAVSTSASRTDRAVPALDGDPYLVVADGRLYWIRGRLHDHDRYPVLDARRQRRSTTSATRSRSSIDAYHGTRHVLSGRRRAIRSRRRSRAIFPGLFKPLDARCRRTCGRTSVIPKTSSRCRRRCTRRTT